MHEHGKPIACLAVASRAMGDLPRLASFANARAITVASWRLPSEVDCAAGWGNSAKALALKATALRRGIRFLHVEDGFFRSVGLGKSGTPPFALSFDSLRPYYDASGPSDIESLIRDTRGTSAISDLVRKHRLTKYNCEPDTPLDLGTDRRSRILIADQVAGDRSIPGALASAADFVKMVETARRERATARLLLRVHPDVAAGKAQGILAPLARELGLEVIADRVSPHALLDGTDEVWTVSSQLGFEALMRGIPVTTFGLPFYAGWGLTDDRKARENRDVLARRRGSPSADDLVTAAVARYCVFVDPRSGERLPAEEGLSRLAHVRTLYEGRRGHYVCIGMRRWKRPMVRAFLGGPFSRVDFMSARKARALPQGDARITVWGHAADTSSEQTLEARHGPLFRMEDGFLRSPGLGSDFIPSASFIVAKGPLYFNAKARNSFEALVAATSVTPELAARAAALRASIVERRLTKYNLRAALPEILEAKAANRPVHLVVGQVETDASIRLGGNDIKRNADLLARARASMPDVCLIYKEHPDVTSGNRPGRLPNDARALADIILDEGDALTAIERADALHTITSLAGFEALLRGKRVYTYGTPFYAGWGLTNDLVPTERRHLTLDELTAYALILYPRYIDPVSSLPCEAEDVIRILSQAPSLAPLRKASPLRQLARALNWLKAELAG